MGNNKSQVEQENIDLKKKTAELKKKLDQHKSLTVTKESLVEEYRLLCDKPWKAAKKAIGEKCPDIDEKQCNDFLSELLLATEKEAKAYHQKVWNQLCFTLNEPLVDCQPDLEKKAQVMPADVEQPVVQQLKASAHKADISQLTMAVTEKFENDKKWLNVAKLVEIKQVIAYQEKAALVCWQMAILNPQMTFTPPAEGEEHCVMVEAKPASKKK